MSDHLPDTDIAIWNRLVDSYKAFAAASKAFLTGNVDRVTLMHKALHGRDWGIATVMFESMQTAELQQIFPDLVFLASVSHGAIQNVRDAILSLPREWVLANIERVAEPLLEKGGYEEYRRLLELYIQLDKELARRLALRATNQQDEDIREAGIDFLNELGK